MTDEQPSHDAPGPPSPGPAHWTQQPFDGRPISFGEHGAPAHLAPPPPPPERNIGPMVAAGLAIVALVAGAVVMQPWSSGPRRTADTLATSDADTGQTAELAGQAPEATTTTTAPPDLATLLPDAAALEGLSRQGIPQSAFDARWVMRGDEALDDDPTEPGCLPPTGSVGGYGRTYSLAPTGTTGELGDYGYVAFVVRRFSSPTEAQTWVAAHEDPSVVECLGQAYHAEDLERFGPTIVDFGIDPLAPVGHGRALTHWVTSTATGRPCTTYTDSFWNQVGSYALVGTFQACGMHLEPAKVRGISERVLAGLTPSPTS